MNKPVLDGIRIADFCWAWAGPHCTEQLAFLGAEVIRIESMQRLCNSRTSHGLSIATVTGVNEGQTFRQLNAAKLSVSLNLRQPKAVELAKKIVKISDIMMQNMRPGVFDRLGMGYDDLKEVKPDIIMCSSSARGANGPERNYAGYAPQQAAVAGMSNLIGYADGGPVQLHATPDLSAATTAAFALLAALHHRRRTGEGQHIDLSQVEADAILIGEVFMDYSMNQRVQSRDGNHDDIMAPHNCYRCRGEDKWVSIAIATDEEWDAFCQAIGNPGWARDDRFSDAYSRWQNQADLDRLIGEWTINHSHYQVTEILQKVGVAAMPSFDNEELFNDPHLKERDFYVELEHPAVDKDIVLAPPWKLSKTPAEVRFHAPLLGEHNEYVFGELLGMSKEEISQLKEEKVIF